MPELPEVEDARQVRWALAHAAPGRRAAHSLLPAGPNGCSNCCLQVSDVIYTLTLHQHTQDLEDHLQFKTISSCEPADDESACTRRRTNEIDEAESSKS